MAEKQTKSDEKKKPVEKFRNHSVEAAVWFDDERGFSVSIGKSYRGENNEWHRVNSYFPNELSDLLDVVKKASEYVLAAGAKKT